MDQAFDKRLVQRVIQQRLKGERVGLRGGEGTTVRAGARPFPSAPRAGVAVSDNFERWARRSESDPFAARKVIHLGAFDSGLAELVGSGGFAGKDAQGGPGTCHSSKVFVEGRSRRQVAKELGISRLTVRKYLEEAVPVRKETLVRPRPIWEAVRDRVDGLLAESDR
jgi:hypothetical protein